METVFYRQAGIECSYNNSFSSLKQDELWHRQLGIVFVKFIYNFKKNLKE